jgi:hypothetical protein
VQNPFINELLHGPLTLIVWIDLDEGFWPIASIGVLPLNFIPDVGGSDPRKTSRKRTVLTDELITEAKYVVHLFIFPVAKPTDLLPMSAAPIDCFLIQ